jgi:hypothetical protein
MKQLYAVLLLSLLGFNGFGQDVAIGLYQREYAFLNVPNPILITSSEVQCNRLKLTTDVGRIEGQGCNYIFYPDKLGEAIIKVFVDKNKKPLKTFSVRARNFPKPYFSISGIDSGYITRMLLLRSNSPTATDLYLWINVDWEIKEYTLSVLGPSSPEVLYHKKFTKETGINFDPETRDVFQKLTHNDRILLTDVRCVSTLGQTEKIDSVQYRIAN